MGEGNARDAVLNPERNDHMNIELTTNQIDALAQAAADVMALERNGEHAAPSMKGSITRKLNAATDRLNAASREVLADYTDAQGRPNLQALIGLERLARMVAQDRNLA